MPRRRRRGSIEASPLVACLVSARRRIPRRRRRGSIEATSAKWHRSRVSGGFRGGDAAAQLKRVCLPDELPERPGFRGGGSIEAEIGEYLCEQFPDAGFRGGDAAAQLKRVEVAPPRRARCLVLSELRRGQPRDSIHPSGGPRDPSGQSGVFGGAAPAAQLKLFN